jgi:N-methylhydantoinase A
MVAYADMDKPDLAALAPNRQAGTEVQVRQRQVYFGSARGFVDTKVYRREQLPAGYTANGPALIEEYGSTTVLGPTDRFEIGRLGEIRVSLGRDSLAV